MAGPNEADKGLLTLSRRCLAGVCRGCRWAFLGTLEEITAGDVQKTPVKASKKLPVLNYRQTLLYLIPLHSVTGDLCIPDC